MKIKEEKKIKEKDLANKEQKTDSVQEGMMSQFKIKILWFIKYLLINLYLPPSNNTNRNPIQIMLNLIYVIFPLDQI